MIVWFATYNIPKAFYLDSPVEEKSLLGETCNMVYIGYFMLG